MNLVVGKSISRFGKSAAKILKRGMVLVILLVSFASPKQTQAPNGLLDTQGSRPVLMPPHPDALAKAKLGLGKLPLFQQDRALAQRLGIDRASASPSRISGVIRSLVILVKFSDQANKTKAAFFDSLLFGNTPGANSVRNYYAQVSYNQVDIVTVNLPSKTGWFQAPQKKSYYAGGAYQNCTGYYPNNCQKLAEDIVDAVHAAGVDFSQYDNDHDGIAEPVMIVHSGPGAEYTLGAYDIWSHSWNLENPRYYNGVEISDYVIMPEYWKTANSTTSDMTIGVFAHEMGHGFWGVPDLYDRDYSSSGVGNWSLMGGGSWNGPTGMGESPAWPDAWTRIQMGFVTPTPVLANTSLSIPQVYGNGSLPTVYKIHTANQGPQEYFLLENRQKDPASFDKSLPGAGLLIWHVDEAMDTDSLQNDYECRSYPDSTCAGSPHYLVDLEQADDQHHLRVDTLRGDAGDPYPGLANNRTFGPATFPGSGTWYTSVPTGISIANISDSAAAMTATVKLTAEVLPQSLALPLVVNDFSPASTYLTAGFEDAVFPPTNWSVTRKNANATWGLDWNPRTGLYSASVYFDSVSSKPQAQDEILLSPTFAATSGKLTFYSQGSLYWCRDAKNQCDLKVWLVKGNWGGGDDVLLRLADQDWPSYSSYTWGLTSIDLTPYLKPGQPVRIGFEYKGLDGDRISMDDLTIQYIP